MSIYSNDDLHAVIFNTADALRKLARGMDRQDESMKLIVLSLELMNKKLNEFTEKNSNTE